MKGEYDSRALETLHLARKASSEMLIELFFLVFFVFDFVFLPTLSHINPDKLKKKKWKRRTHFFGPRDGKLSISFSNTLGSRKVPFSGGELILN